MKIQKRTNVFETNSSSSHSLVIRTDNVVKDYDEEQYYTIEEIKQELKDECYLSEDETVFEPRFDDEDWVYERAPFRILDTFTEKLKYVSGCLPRENIKEILCEYVPTLKRVIFPEMCYASGFGGIAVYIQNKDLIKNFLTNRKFVIIADGDEYCIWEDFCESGLINKKVIENSKEACDEKWRDVVGIKYI